MRFPHWGAVHFHEPHVISKTVIPWVLFPPQTLREKCLIENNKPTHLAYAFPCSLQMDRRKICLVLKSLALPFSSNSDFILHWSAQQMLSLQNAMVWHSEKDLCPLNGKMREGSCTSFPFTKIRGIGGEKQKEGEREKKRARQRALFIMRWQWFWRRTESEQGDDLTYDPQIPWCIWQVLDQRQY